MLLSQSVSVLLYRFNIKAPNPDYNSAKIGQYEYVTIDNSRIMLSFLAKRLVEDTTGYDKLSTLEKYEADAMNVKQCV